jgi:hypothetical protein
MRSGSENWNVGRQKKRRLITGDSDVTFVDKLDRKQAIKSYFSL